MSDFREYHKILSRGKRAEVKVREVAIADEEPVPRHMWTLGIVLELFEGCNGFSRGADSFKLGRQFLRSKGQSKKLTLLSILDKKKNTKNNLTNTKSLSQVVTT